MPAPNLDWHRVREQVDARFRSHDLAQQFMSAIGAGDLIVDLSCGTGTNCRYLAPLSDAEHTWLGIDIDADLLAVPQVALPQGQIRLKQMDLAQALSSGVPRGKGTAITASAFLDLASQDWLVTLAQHCCQNPLLIAMTAAGPLDWNIDDPLDAEIIACLSLHQRSDHGFGPAMGADAAPFLAGLLRQLGCQVDLVATDWTLNGDDSDFIEIVLQGILRRVRPVLSRDRVDAWEQCRRQQLSEAQLQLRLPHWDLLALP